MAVNLPTLSDVAALQARMQSLATHLVQCYSSSIFYRKVLFEPLVSAAGERRILSYRILKELHWVLTGILAHPRIKALILGWPECGGGDVLSKLDLFLDPPHRGVISNETWFDQCNAVLNALDSELMEEGEYSICPPPSEEYYRRKWQGWKVFLAVATCEEGASAWTDKHWEEQEDVGINGAGFYWSNFYHCWENIYPSGTIRLSRELRCEETYAEIGTVAYVYGNVHDYDVPVTLENASEGIEAPDIPITGFVQDVFVSPGGNHNYKQRWDCEPITFPDGPGWTLEKTECGWG